MKHIPHLGIGPIINEHIATYEELGLGHDDSSGHLAAKVFLDPAVLLQNTVLIGREWCCADPDSETLAVHGSNRPDAAGLWRELEIEAGSMIDALDPIEVFGWVVVPHVEFRPSIGWNCRPIGIFATELLIEASLEVRERPIHIYEDYHRQAP
jgi:hypothetical protein